MPRIYRIEPEEPGLDSDPADQVFAEMERLIESGENILFAQSFPRQTPRRDLWLIITDGESEKEEQR
jgi:hypothetical protein